MKDDSQGKRQETSLESAGARDLSQALREVTWANDEATHSLARRLGLGVNDVVALDHLLQSGPLGPVELGHRLGMRPASATALVDRLEKAGHVERRPHPTDRRRLALEPTPHAVQEMLRKLQPLLDELDAAAEELTPDERRTVARYLRRVAGALGEYGSG